MRRYYQVTLNPATAKEQLIRMRTLGKVASPLAHEWPRISLSPDKSVALLRVEWAQAGDEATFEKDPGVKRLSEDEAIALVRSWQK